MYVMTMPATTFATADVEPNDTRTPRKIETPRKAGDSAPGR